MAMLMCLINVQGQPPVNFHHLTVRNGLNDGIINAIVQDRYGYMWFASYGALNRFNSRQVKKYEHIPGDSSSAPGGIVHALFCNGTGRLFIGGDEGLMEFDYATDRFLRVPGFTNHRITAISELNSDELLVVAGFQLYRYSISAKTKQILVSSGSTRFFEQHPVYSLYKKDGRFYAGTKGGYIVYDQRSGTAVRKEVKMLNGASADAVIADAKDQIWITNVFLFRLIRVAPATGEEMAMDRLPEIAATGVQQSFLDFAADQDHVWITTSLTGLIQYDVHTGSVRFHQKNLLKPGSIAENILRTIYLAGDGTLWVSMLGGVDYFHPKKNLFDVLFPFPALGANQLARGFTEDQYGNYWFTTGDGIIRHTPGTNEYKTWRNEAGKPPVIYYNSSRAVLADGNNVWIATGKGMNRYDISAGTMHFLTARDSLPEIFYLNINKDSKGQVWFCSNMQDGLYYYSPADGKIRSIRNHPVLKQYTGFGVRRVFEDAQHRLWIGFNGRGYAVYDPQRQNTRYWYNHAGNDSSFNSNMVIDITQDKSGVIWLTTFNGVRGIDPEKQKYYWLTTAAGLPSNVTNGVLADDFNRLWISTSAGLALVDSSRRSVYRFDESYGLPGTEFPEHQAHQNRRGDFIFPSNKGYVQFSPSSMPLQANHVPFFIENISVPGRTGISHTNYRELTSLRLKPNENFFTITLEGLNYSHPEQTWYAYKLDGLETDWHYTQDPKAVYTSVPGGSYTFRYKAAAGNDRWDVTEKTLTIRIRKMFYKTEWFWVLVIFTAAGLLFMLYRYRLQQREKLFELEGRAQKLEKEKTQVMYESLKQQLNPHFLFNSLTSLSGLIEADQQLAGNFLKQMSKIYRYILQSRDSETVKLKEEMEFVKTYINLQQTRFSRGLVVNMEAEADALNKRIPPVTLQNLIENAIKHNIIDAESPLVISITTGNDYLVVKNNLQRKQMVETSNRQGLASLQSLYSYLSDRPVIITETADTFCIKLPLI